MKSIIYPLAFVLAIAFSSCNYESPKYKALKAQNDSIKTVQQALERDAQEYVFIFNHIGKDLDKIKNKEGEYIGQIKTQLKIEENAAVNDNIAKINSIFQANQEEIGKLKKQARHNAFRASELQRNVDTIRLQLEEETTKNVTLQDEVAAKNVNIDKLNADLQALTTELDATKKQLADQTSLVAKYEVDLFTGYYITGSKSDLRNKKVLTKTGLCKTALFYEAANNANFTKVNILETTVITLPNSVKGKVLSAHPKSSYRFAKQGDDKVIQITNPEIFWSITNYLVIQ